MVVTEASDGGVCPKSTKTCLNEAKDDYFKINCDGAFKQEDRSGGRGYVIRGGDSVVICSGYGRLGKVLEASHAEIIACLQALQRVTELGIQKVVLETDAMMVVQAANSPEFDRCSLLGEWSAVGAEGKSFL